MINYSSIHLILLNGIEMQLKYMFMRYYTVHMNWHCYWHVT